ncbi:hypothetical protein [Sporosarcina sp. SAFN-015]|uniref:hypothetical protein n=1 Tax=Sporosarcina sp. SAFN-015 TaxID=3387274 RepID=UPI003F823DA0
MNFYKKVSFLLLIFLVLVNVKGNEGIAANGEVTLKEAIDIGFQRAKEWNVNATLTGANSVDETMGGSRGETGKRFKWFVTFMVPDTEDHLIIGISEMKITVFEPIKQSPNPTIPHGEIKLDSTDALQIAKDKYKLKQGKDWATGYHFTLDSIEGEPILTVVGNDRDNRFTRISINAKNGDVVSAIHKVPYGGGLLSIRNGSEHISKKGMAITGVVAGNNKLVVWGDKKPTQFSTTKKPFIEMSDGNGETWKVLEAGGYVTHAWFDRNDRLYAATEKELWTDITSKNKGSKILSLDQAIEHVDYSSNNHIAVLSNETIYYTKNQGESWKEALVPKPFYVIQISDNGDLIGLTEERKILQKKKDGWSEIPLPDLNEAPYDMKVIHNRLYITTKSGIWSRNLKEETWSEIPADEMVVKFIKKGEKLFGYGQGDAIYSIDTNDERKPKKVFDAVDRIVYDIDFMGDTLWVATVPNYSWEEMTVPNE